MYNPLEEIVQEILSRLQESISTNRAIKDTEDEIIDRNELLKRLNITEPTAIRWGKAGKIPEMRIGSIVRYNWPKVIEALEK